MRTARTARKPVEMYPDIEGLIYKALISERDKAIQAKQAINMKAALASKNGDFDKEKSLRQILKRIRL